MDTRNICTVTSQAEKALKSSAWALVSALRMAWLCILNKFKIDEFQVFP